MECRSGLAMRILSVCLSVRLSNAWIVTKRKKHVSRFLHRTKDHLRKKMVSGGDPFYLTFWVNRTRSSEIVDFEQIIARSALNVT